MHTPSVFNGSCDACVASSTVKATQASQLQKSRRGFSFAEVMFAVVILGIGFIMVAAVFPVAIQQTQANGEENIAASVARQAAAAIASMPMTYANPIYTASYDHTVTPTPPTSVQTLLTFPPTVKNYVKGTDPNSPDAPAVVVPLVGQRWNFTKTISILPSDPRYAYAAFYKRDNGTTSAELIVISMAVRNRATYSPGQDELSAQQIAANNANPSNPQPAQTNITTAPADFPSAQPHTLICPDTVTLGTALPGGVGSSGEGSSAAFTAAAVSPAPVGRTYSLGRGVLPTGSTLGPFPMFELMGGDGMALTAGSNGKWGTAGAIRDTTQAVPQPTYINSPSTIQPTVAYARLFTTPDAPQGRIQLNVTPSAQDAVPAVATTGAFVIIADDFPSLPSLQSAPGGAADYRLQPNIPGVYTVGAMNGRIFRLGAPVPATPANTNANPVIQPGTFNLDPAYGMRPIPPGGSYSPDALPNPAMVQAAMQSQDPDQAYLQPLFYGSVKVYIVGVGRTDPSNVNSAYSGPAQDIGAFASYIQVQ